MKTIAETNRYITLAENGFTSYHIVTAAGASLTVIHAAEELRNFLNRLCGARFNVVSDAERKSGNEIIIGKNKRSAELMPDFDYSALGKEGFALKTSGSNVLILANEGRGLLYGVYTLLEDYLGCRFFTEDMTVVPKRAALYLPKLDDMQKPALEFRDPYFSGYNDGDFYARLKANGDAGRLCECHGNRMAYAGFVHTLNNLVSPDIWFESHPEYFAEIDGKRTNGYAQPCLSNPDVLAIVIENVKKRLRENPTAEIISVSQNDNQRFCTCPHCREIDEHEGSHAGTLICFVNAVAEAIEDEFPDVAVDTLAYQYTRRPPLHVRPRKNVIVRLCSIECCFSHPLEECDSSFKNDLIGWSEICERLHIWDYVVNFAHTLSPFPNFKVLQPNIKYFIAHSVTGIFEEGNNSSRESGEFNALKQYIIGKLLWNPDYDVETGISEFMTAYYGMAAAEIRNYFELIHSQITPDTHMRIYDAPHTAYLNPEMLAEADKIFDRAERVADDDIVLARVKKLRLSVRYVELANTPVSDPTRAAAAEEFIADVRASGVTSYREGARLEHTEPLIREGKI